MNDLLYREEQKGVVWSWAEHGDPLEKCAANKFGLHSAIPNVHDFWRKFVVPATARSASRPVELYPDTLALNEVNVHLKNVILLTRSVVYHFVEAELLRQFAIHESNGNSPPLFSFIVLRAYGNAVQQFDEIYKSLCGIELRKETKIKLGAKKDKICLATEIGSPFEKISHPNQGETRKARERIILHRNLSIHHGHLCIRGVDDEWRIPNFDVVPAPDVRLLEGYWPGYPGGPDEMSPEKWILLSEAVESVRKESMSWINDRYSEILCEFVPLIPKFSYLYHHKKESHMNGIPTGPQGPIS